MRANDKPSNRKYTVTVVRAAKVSTTKRISAQGGILHTRRQTHSWTYEKAHKRFDAGGQTGSEK